METKHAPRDRCTRYTHKCFFLCLRCTCAHMHVCIPAPTRKYTDTYVCTHTSPHKVVGNNYCLPILFLYLLVGFYRSAEILSFHILDLVLSQDRAPALNIWSSPRSH